jgi:hypothetical protein
MPRKIRAEVFPLFLCITSDSDSGNIYNAQSKLSPRLTKPNQTQMYFPFHYQAFPGLSGLTSLKLCYPVLHLLIVILHGCVVGVLLFKICKLLECERELFDDVLHGHCVIRECIACLQRVNSVSKPERISRSLYLELVKTQRNVKQSSPQF